MEKITAIRIVLGDGTEYSIPKDDFLQTVKDEYLHLLPESEINKDEMYKLVGFTLAVLQRSITQTNEE